MNSQEQLLEKILALQAALEEQNPEIKAYCIEIHNQLLKEPELTYILQPEQIGTYVRGLSKLAQIELAVSPAKKKLPKNISVEDLM